MQILKNEKIKTSAMTNSTPATADKKLYFTFKSCSKLCSFQISYNITFINYSSLLGANFYNASRKISKDLFILSPRSGNITNTSSCWYFRPTNGAIEGPSTETSHKICPLSGAIIGSALVRLYFRIVSSSKPLLP